MDVLLNAAGIDFIIQLVGFLISYTFQTEKIYDLTGSMTYLLLIQVSLRSNSRVNDRQILLSILTSIWAIRLGMFLCGRTIWSNGDRRFDKVKTKPITFFIYWIIQGVWVFITLLPVLLVNRTTRNNIFSQRDYLGVAVWTFGFLFEVIADWQKIRFKIDPSTSDTFISHGLWSISRHPNYFGEITLWFGVFITASSALQGWEWMSVLSPIFVYLLITRVSGIPILEKSAERRFGHLATYKFYSTSVPQLVPFFGRP